MTKVVSLQERRKYPRVSDAVALRIEAGNDEKDSFAPLEPLPTHIVKMSCGGLRFSHDESLDTDTPLQISLRVASTDETMHINSRVVASGEEKTPSGTRCDKPYFVQIEFQSADGSVRQLLQDHINYVIGKTGVKASYIA